MLDTMVDLKSSKGDSNEKMSKLEDGQTKDGPTRRFSVTDFWKRLPVDQDEADSIGSRKHVVKDAKLVLQLNIFQFLQICFMAVQNPCKYGILNLDTYSDAMTIKFIEKY